MPLTTSDATADEIRRYTEVESHVFAVALNRRTGWPMTAVLDLADEFVVDVANGDAAIHSVSQVFCVDGDGNFWDVHGFRSEEEHRAGFEDGLVVDEYGQDPVGDEEQLAMYVYFGNDDIGRPLPGYTEDDVTAAAAVVDRAFADLLADRAGPASPKISPR